MSGERTCIQQLLNDLDETLSVGRDDCDNDNYSEYLNAIHDVKIRLKTLISQFGVRAPGQCTLKASRAYTVMRWCNKHGFSPFCADNIFNTIDSAVDYAITQNKGYANLNRYFCVVDLATNKEVWNPRCLDLWQEDYGEFTCEFTEGD